MFTRTDIKFPATEADYPSWLPEILEPKPDIRDLSLEKDGQRYTKLKKRLEIKSFNDDRKKV
jgi:hypothetical protein